MIDVIQVMNFTQSWRRMVVSSLYGITFKAKSTPIYENRFEEKVYIYKAHCRTIMFGKEIVHVSFYNSCFACGQFADDQHFEQIFMFATTSIFGRCGTFWGLTMNINKQKVREKCDVFLCSVKYTYHIAFYSNEIFETTV